MSKFFFIGQEVLHTNKAKCLFDLHEQGLNIPLTVIVTDLNSLSRIYDYFNINFSIYLRVNYSDFAYPHYEYKICNLLNVETELKIILNKLRSKNVNHYDIIVQEMLNLTWSGVALKKSNILLLEIVYGNLSYLLREGIYFKRFFIDEKANILKVEEGSQKYYRNLVDNNLIINDVMNVNINEEIIFNNIKNFDINHSLYEFGCNNNVLYFLESKKINPNSYLNVLNSLSDCQPIIIYRDHNFDLLETILIKNPMFSNIDNISSNKKYHISSGALLSHLNTYLANNSINSFY